MIVQVLSSSRGGAATHVRHIVAGLPATVVMPFDGGHVRADDLGGPVLEWKGVRDFAAQLRRLRPDVVHAHGSRAAWWTFLGLLLSGSKARFVYSIHGFVTPFHTEPRRTLQLLAERLVGSRCQAIVADARAERQEALRWGLAGPAKLVTVYLGFDLDRLRQLGPADRARARQELGLDPQMRHVLCVCRLDRPRDFDTLLEGFTAVSNAFLHIVGHGPFQERIEAKIAQLGLGHRVKLWGLVRDVVEFYAAADLFVLTSWGWEGCPVTVIEAQAAGLPVVVSDAGGSGEAIIPGQSGLLVERRNSAAMGAALQRLLDSPGPMGPRGREHALANFQLPRMVEHLQRIYRCAIKTT